MKHQTLIQEYGRAINGLVAANETEGVIGFFQTVVALMRASQELNTAMNHPLLSTDQKVTVLLANVTGDIPRVGREAVRDLVSNRRMVLLPEIVEHLRTLHYTATGVVEVVVTSAFPVAAEQQTALTEQLSRFTGKKVLPRFQLDHGLIGGFALKIGDLVIDNSVKTELHKLKMRLT
jgi:F-type H+-transporting ATPase subunit delta